MFLKVLDPEKLSSKVLFCSSSTKIHSLNLFLYFSLSHLYELYFIFTKLVSMHTCFVTTET